MPLGVGYQYWIAYSFECMPPDVRQIMKLFADTYNPVSGFVIAGVVDDLWEVADIPNPEYWKALYHFRLQIQESTIIIADNEVRIYLSNRQWMNMLKLELLSGRVSVGMPFPCKRLASFGGAVPIA
jgi:hypothetical protein